MIAAQRPRPAAPGGAFPCSLLAWWCAKQFGRTNFQFASEPLDHIERGGILRAFETAHIGPINPGAMSEFLLRQAYSLTVMTQIDSKYLAQAHKRERAALQSI